MSLLVWLPLRGNLDNYGKSSVTTTVSGTTAYANGKIGQGLTCNGSSYWNVVGQALGATASICCWAKTSTNGKMPWVIIATSSNKLNLYCSSIYTLNTGDGNGNPFKDDSGNNVSVLIDGNWHHISVTFGDNKAKLYIDGDYKGTAQTFKSPATTSDNTIRIAGGYNGSHTYDWNGMMNDFRIYDTCLSPEQIKEISRGLVLHYPLNNRALGGRNLVLNSCELTPASSKTNKNISVRGSASRQLQADGFYESKCTAAWQGLSTWANAQNFSVGDKITYSFFIYCNGNVRAFSFYPMMYNSAGTRDTSTGLPISIDGGKFTTVNSKAFTATTTTVPEKHYVTFEWNQSMKDIIDNGGSIELSIQVHGTWSTGDWVCLFAPKIEKGLIPTPWSPNPNDTLSTRLGLYNNTIYDISGYKNNGTITGSLEYSTNTPKYQVSTYFNGSSWITNNKFNLTSSAWTVSFWYYYTADISAYQSIITLSRNAGADADKKFSAMPNTSKIWFKIEDKSVTVNSLIINKWTNITFVCDGTNGRIYENGIQKGSVSSISSIFTDCSDLVIGARASSAGAETTSYRLNGNLSDVRIYATALTAGEVLNLYQRGRVN